MTAPALAKRLALPFPVSVTLPLAAGARCELALEIPPDKSAAGGRLFVARKPRPLLSCEHCSQPIDPELPMVRLVGVRVLLPAAIFPGATEAERTRDLLPELPTVDSTGWRGVPISILRTFGLALPEVPFPPGSILTASILVSVNPSDPVSWGPEGAAIDQGARDLAALAGRLTGLELSAVLSSKESS